MPPRNRKKASAPLEAQDSQSAHAAVASNHPEVTSRGPRRSSRRSGRSPLTKEKGASNTTAQDQVDEMDLSEASLPTAPVEHVAKQLENEDSDAANALRRLGEMETSFKKDIKRRRLQIEESMVEDAGANRSAPAMRSRVVRTASDVVHLDHVMLTPDEEKENAWEPPVGGESVADDEPLEVVKGANRPPAVNSDYLPLPWRGRLGYVSPS